MYARVTNVIIGAWLFLSAFLWPHVPAQFHNAWMSGLLAVTFALLAMGGLAWARVLNIAVGAWLILSSIILRPANAPTLANHLLFGFLLVLLAAISKPDRARARVAPVAGARA